MTGCQWCHRCPKVVVGRAGALEILLSSMVLFSPCIRCIAKSNIGSTLMDYKLTKKNPQSWMKFWHMSILPQLQLPAPMHPSFQAKPHPLHHHTSPCATMILSLTSGSQHTLKMNSLFLGHPSGFHTSHISYIWLPIHTLSLHMASPPPSTPPKTEMTLPP